MPDNALLPALKNDTLLELKIGVGETSAEFSIDLDHVGIYSMILLGGDTYEDGIYGGNVLINLDSNTTFYPGSYPLLSGVQQTGLFGFMPSDLTGELQSPMSGTIGVLMTDKLVVALPNADMTADAFTGSTANEVLLSGALNDTLDGGVGDDIVLAGGGDDFLFDGAADGTDKLYGGSGDDVVVALSPHAGEVYDGGRGVDRIDLSVAQNAVVLTLGSDAGGGATVSNFEFVIDSKFDDSITGTAANESLDGYVGADTLAGGAGDDVYFIDTAADVVVEGVEAGNDIVVATLTTTLGDNVEQLFLTGMDPMDGTGNVLDNIIYGTDGVNRIDGAGGYDLLQGFGGNDRLVDRDGGDMLFGGAGDDIYDIRGGTSAVIEDFGNGYDTVVTDVDTTMTGNVERLRLIGTGDIDGTGIETADRILGNAGANVLTGWDGADTMTGGAGADTLDGGAGDDDLGGGTGDDLVRGGAGGDQLLGNLGNDLLRGGTDGDSLAGGIGSDSLFGEAGDDLLLADKGFDRLNGGLGADVFSVGLGVRTATIVDFGAGDTADAHDVLDFSRLEKANGGLAIDMDDLLIAQEGSTTAIRFDLDGDGAADLFGDSPVALTLKLLNTVAADFGAGDFDFMAK